jgi:hypothetical protein
MANNNDNPYGDQLPEGGSSIWVWLIIGGTIIFIFVMLWEKRSRAFLMAEAAGVEESVREDIRVSFGELRDGQFKAVLDRDTLIQKKLDWLLQLKPRGYVIMRVSRLFIRAEAIVMIGGLEHIKAAEELFTQGMELMGYSGGSLWEFGLVGRAKARYLLSRHADAENDLNILLSYNPSYGAAYYWRSLAREKLGNEDGAWEDERQAMALGSWPPPSGFNRAFREEPSWK